MKKIRVILLLILVFIIFVGIEVIYLPFIHINSSDTINQNIKNELSKVSYFNFALKHKIQQIEINGERIKVNKNSFLGCEITTNTNDIAYIVRLNGYLVGINKLGVILEEQIEEKSEFATKFLIFNININSKGDAKIIFNKEVKPFLSYLISGNSTLGPAISEIDFNDLTGLSFTTYDKKKIILGRRNDYDLAEREIFKIKNLLVEKKEYTNYNEFDFRFNNRVICKK